MFRAQRGVEGIFGWIKVLLGGDVVDQQHLVEVRHKDGFEG